MKAAFSKRINHIFRSLSAFACLLFATHCCFAQSRDYQSLLNQYQRARDAYASKQFEVAAELFQAVADQCPDSELAIQCGYFSAMSEWYVKPCDAVCRKMNTWQERAAQFKKEAIRSGRKFDPRLVEQWTESVVMIQAKWDRSQQRFADAELRLRQFLQPNDGPSEKETASAPAWIELGTLLLQSASSQKVTTSESIQQSVPEANGQESSKQFDAAKACFDRAIECCRGRQDIERQACWGAALACWKTQQYSEANRYLMQIPTEGMDTDMRIQTALLKMKISRALSEAVDLAKELEPIVQIALAGNPQASTLYELAMALWDAGQSEDSSVVLLHLVKQFPQSPVAVEARVRLARSACDSKDWNSAIKYCNESIEMGCPNEVAPHARLIRGQAYFELGGLEQAKLDLESALEMKSLDIDVQASVRFYLAETLYRLEDWAAAESHWGWLLDKASSQSSDAGAAGWVPVVLLRTAELLAQKKEWEEAKRIVLRIRNDFPKCNHQAEVDYLLARCLISNAEFDAARQALRGVSDEQVFAPMELRARALWMTGETYLMQRQFAQARAAYEAVLLVPNQNYWHSASLLQIGLCCESLRDSQAARIAYERLESEFGDSPFASSARERKNLLPTPSIATQSEQNSLGTKR